jgi:ATP-dependent DNA ligase
VVVTLPLASPLAPQLALSRKALPEGEQWVYEIKLDGFRCLAFMDGQELFLQSRGSRPLARYFPELQLPSGRYVLDGEIVVRLEGGEPKASGASPHYWFGRENFDALQQRLHPAASRVARLAAETPAVYVVFDLLARDDESWLQRPLHERRAGLEELLAQAGWDAAPVELMPTTDSPAAAQLWLADAEGAIAKERDAPYQPGKRLGMVKIKRVRTLDAVVVGWRPGKEPDTVGALILGLYDGEQLRVVGHCSGLSAAEKRRLVDFFAPYASGERGCADPSRWTAGRDLEWVGLRPELVVEIDFDHVSAGRIRHGAKLRRWREDKDPRGCTFDQLFG